MVNFHERQSWLDIAPWTRTATTTRLLHREKPFRCAMCAHSSNSKWNMSPLHLVRLPSENPWPFVGLRSSMYRLCTDTNDMSRNRPDTTNNGKRASAITFLRSHRDSCYSCQIICALSVWR